MSVIFAPRDYQRALISHGLAHKRLAMFAGMGTGKTVSACSVAAARIRAGQARRALVLAPKLVAGSVWPDEVAKWSHLDDLTVQPILGSQYQRHQALHQSADIYAMNYDNLQWLVKTLGDNWPFDMVLCDEATRLRGFRIEQGTVRMRALAYVAPKTRYWINMTGTPTPKGLQDLWGQTWFLDGGKRLGDTFTAFQNRWFSQTFDGYGLEPLPGAFEEITSLISDLCLTIEAKDYLDLPPLITKNIFVDLPAKAHKHYKAVQKDLFTMLERDPVRAMNQAGVANKCLQIASGAVYVESEEDGRYEVLHDEKLDALEDVIEEAAGMPLLVVYQFKHDLARLKKRFPRGASFKDSKNPNQVIADFNLGRIPILFIHPQSAGHGLNLQHGTNIIVFFSQDWNLEYYQQAIERIGPTRQVQAGYNRPVHVIHIAARGTIEQTAVMPSRDNKSSMQSALMAAMKRVA